MKMLEIAALPNGAHRNQTYHGVLPGGWAVVPEDMELANFPFGEVTAAEITRYRGDEQEPYGVMTVVAWEPLPVPETEPAPIPEPSQLDRIEAQVTYTAMMTDTLLEV